MLFTARPSLIFLSIILIVGILTSTTDLWQKKIYNAHLFLGAGLGLFAIWHTLLINPNIVMPHFADGGLAFVIGWLLYHFGIWRGGDAKLFALFAFLMPPLKNDSVLFYSTINLFACSFIAGALILLPFFIKDVALNYKTMTDRLLRLQKHEFLFAAARITIFFSWVLYPFYYLANMLHIPALSLLLTYLIFTLSHHFLRRIEATYPVIGCGIIFGFLMRLWLNPHSLHWPTLPYSILKIMLFSALSAVIYAMLRTLKEYHERIPFAPLLFIGCLLSYTPFLTWIMYFIPRFSR